MPFSWKKHCLIWQTAENPPTVRLGLCCINNSLRKQDIFCSRTLIARTYSLEKAKTLVSKNLEDLQTILEWNVKNKIYHYRLSSDMFPRITDPNIDLDNRLKISDYKEILYSIGNYAKQTNHRITMHPGQYNQVGAEKESVFLKTVEDLSIHSEILDSMGMDNNAILTVHGGGVYGDKESTTRRWIEQFDDLPRNVKDRLAIENCERQYNIEDVLYISEETNIPVIFDSHHFNCYNKIYDVNFIATDYMPYVVDSWKSRRIVSHISEQKENARIGAHSDFIEDIPDYFLSVPEEYGVGIDIEVEAKAKEAAIFKLYYNFPHIEI
jgi:UV DNA damage endonuclease